MRWEETRRVERRCRPLPYPAEPAGVVEQDAVRHGLVVRVADDGDEHVQHHDDWCWVVGARGVRMRGWEALSRLLREVRHDEPNTSHHTHARTDQHRERNEGGDVRVLVPERVVINVPQETEAEERLHQRGERLERTVLLVVVEAKLGRVGAVVDEEEDPGEG